MRALCFIILYSLVLRRIQYITQYTYRQYNWSYIYDLVYDNQPGTHAQSWSEISQLFVVIILLFILPDDLRDQLILGYIRKRERAQQRRVARAGHGSIIARVTPFICRPPHLHGHIPNANGIPRTPFSLARCGARARILGVTSSACSRFSHAFRKSAASLHPFVIRTSPRQLQRCLVTLLQLATARPIAK